MDAMQALLALQWGRDQLIAELASVNEWHDPSRSASMGPRSIDRGTKQPTVPTARHAIASMGPRSIDRGTNVMHRVIAGDIRASMGPRSIDRGTLRGSR